LINYYILIKDYDKAILEIKKTIDSDINDSDGYYKLYVIYYEKKNYLKSFLEITKAIEKKKSFNDYYVLDFDGKTKIELSDMYYKRAELSKILNSNKLMCEDYITLLGLKEDNQELKSKVESLILENCN
tara:strand:- start:117 stop:503 length:387 start_codon:yes stop_codon:yes gene_type:complete